MRNRLKTANNKHFSEELFYADHPSEGVTPCFNGNISAIRTAWTDTANTYIYAYDSQNRLLSSKRLTDYAAHNSELFGYDEMGNITSLKRFSGSRMIDDLDLDYGNDGHQLLKVTDQGHNADLYSTIEYHNAAAQTDTTMFYDANGNLIRDLDRGISAYSIFNSLTTQGLNPRAAYDSAVEIIGSITKFVLDGGGTKVMKTAVSIAPKITSTAVAVAPYVLATGLVGIAGWSYYKAGEYFANMVNDLNGMLNSKNFWGNLYGFDCYEKSW